MPGTTKVTELDDTISIHNTIGTFDIPVVKQWEKEREEESRSDNREGEIADKRWNKHGKEKERESRGGGERF